MASLEQWIKDFPVITRTYMAGALLTTAACALDLLSPFSLYFSLPMIVHRHQYWRLLTNFFFFGANFSLDFLFHMFFLVRYCRALEEGSFRGRTADFFFLILFGAALMTCIAPLVSLHFLGSSLTFMMVYIWARRNPFARMNFLGLFTFTAPYLPWVLLSFSCLLGNNGLVDVVGIGVGHLYYFLEDVYPLMLPSRKRLLQTPHLLTLLFHTHEDIAAAPAQQPQPQPQPQQQPQQPAEQPRGRGGGGGEEGQGDDAAESASLRHPEVVAALPGDVDGSGGAELDEEGGEHPPLVAEEELIAHIQHQGREGGAGDGAALQRRRRSSDAQHPLDQQQRVRLMG